MRFGAVLGYCKSFGAVRCGFEKMKILRCGSPLNVHTHSVFSTVRFGGVLKNQESCGAVRFVFFMCRTVRFGAVFRYSKSYGAVRCCDKSTVRFGVVPR